MVSIHTSLRTAFTVTCVVAALPAAAAAADTVSIELRAAPRQQHIRPGQSTDVWAFEGTLLEGPAGALQTIPNSYLGPIIRVHKGDRLNITFINNLPDESIVHWHGMDVPSIMDGHPHDAIGTGEVKEYTYEIINRAGTYWFHPHPHGATGLQVMRGLAGMLIVSDDEEQALDLPSGEFELPLILQDRRFDANNQFIYQMSMAGYLGDHILVNGQPDYSVSAATRMYRLRILNGSNARIYKLAWSDGTPVTVIATDGGLLEEPVTRPYVMLAPGERIEVWADFTGYEVGTQVKLKSLAFQGGGGGSPTLPNGSEFEIMEFSIDRAERETRVLPAVLSDLERLQMSEVTNAENPRTFPLTFELGQWLINGAPYDMHGVAENEMTTTNTLEIWKFTNTDTDMVTLPHPIHAHGAPYQVYSRSILPQFAANYATVSEGYVDDGWEDTILLMPGESITLLKRTSRYPGMFLFHCHNLEHEDMGMMRNYMLMKTCPGDINDDGSVGVPDLLELLSAWGANPGSLADINQDETVGVPDLLELLSGWGACPE